jgi:hypothetical protein
MDKTLVEKLLGSSPTTSIIGYVGFVLSAMYPIITEGEFDLKRDWPKLVMGVYLAWMGRQAKDSNGVKASEGYAMKAALVKAEVIAPAPPPEPKQEVVINEEKVAEIQSVVSPQPEVEEVKKKPTTRKIKAAKPR